MNRIYKVIWSKAKNCYVVASELAKRNSKGSGTRSLRMAAVTLGVMAALLAGGEPKVEAAIGSTTAVTGVNVDSSLVTATTGEFVTGVTQAASTTGTVLSTAEYTAGSVTPTTGEFVTGVTQADSTTGLAVENVDFTGQTTNKLGVVTAVGAVTGTKGNALTEVTFTDGTLTTGTTDVVTAVGAVTDTKGNALTAVTVDTSKVTTETANFLTGTSEDATAINKTISNTEGIERSGTTTTIEGVVSVEASGTTTVGATAGSQIVMDAGTLTVDKTTTLKGKLTVKDGGAEITAGGLTVKDGGADITGNSKVTGTLETTDKLTVKDGGAEITAGGLTVKDGGADITGNSKVTGTLGVTGDTTIGDKFTVTAADGSLSAAGGNFTADADGALSAAGGNFTADADGALSAAGGNFTADKDGALSAAGGNFTVDKDGNTAAAGTLTVEGDTVLNSNLTVGGEALFNEGKTNQVLIDESGIRVGLSSTQIDEAGFYAGGHTWDEAKAAVGSDGRIKGTQFMVDGKTYIDKDGLNANNQKIRNVAPGDISPTSTDAMIGRQLYEVREELQADINRVGAGAAAMANLRPLDMGNKFSMAMGVGSYRSKTAMAMGLFYKPSDRVAFNVSGTVGNGHNMIGAGVSFALDKVVKPVGGAAAQAEIQNLKAENEEIKAENAEIKAQLEELKAIVQSMKAAAK